MSYIVISLYNIMQNYNIPREEILLVRSDHQLYIVTVRLLGCSYRECRYEE